MLLTHSREDLVGFVNACNLERMLHSHAVLLASLHMAPLNCLELRPLSPPHPGSEADEPQAQGRSTRTCSLIARKKAVDGLMDQISTML